MVSEEIFDDSDEPPELDDILDDDDDDDEDDADMVLDDSSVDEDFVEFDPSGRYGRYAEVLGKGAMKTVYRAYDMVDCKEVAWNKARPPLECCDEQATAVQREIHLLRRLSYKGIIKLYRAWGDDATGDTDFITELCSSTLLEYRMTHKHISRKAVKSWGRQILQGLAHLHMQDPPIIHRDLKCENILVKCRSNTALKIGDFGSATFLDETHHMHTLVGTPEFMAPEMFEEDYNELVDVYSFGMCMLELLTRECPYSECKSLSQIYKKVINGEKPEALHKVTDPQASRLINRCLLPASKRPSVSELLSDPFLQSKGARPNLGHSMKSYKSMPDLRSPRSSLGVKSMLSFQGSVDKLSRPSVATKRKAGNTAQADGDPSIKVSRDLGCKKAVCTRSPSFRRTYRVTGRVEDQNTLRLKIRIQESSRSCDIDFPFDLRYDSARSVAEEMVRALEYSESDLHTIANLISEEIAALAPEIEESSEMGAFSFGLGGAFPSPSFLRSSYSGAGKFESLADQIARPKKASPSLSFGRSSYSSGGKFDSIAGRMSHDRKVGNSVGGSLGTAMVRKVGNSVGGISRTDLMSVSEDKFCEDKASAAEERQPSNMMSSESDSMVVRDESSSDSLSCKYSFEQAENKVTSKKSPEKPSASSGLNWGPFGKRQSKAGASMSTLDGSSPWVTVGVRSAFGKESNQVLDNSIASPLPSEKSLSKFKQLPELASFSRPLPRRAFAGRFRHV